MDANLLPYLTPAERGWLALAEAATPGTWSVLKRLIGVHRPAEFLPLATMFQYNHAADAAFIAAARTAIPALLEALAMARRAIIVMPEWTRGMYGMQNCLWCGGEEYDGEPYQDPPDDAYPVWHGHDPDCPRQAALRGMEL